MYEIGIEAQDIPIPQWVPRLVLPIGFGLLAFRFSEVLYRIVTGKEARLLGDEAADALKHRLDQPDDGSEVETKR
jgi:C4-dicarboxylate transporter DctQ subunit